MGPQGERAPSERPALRLAPGPLGPWRAPRLSCLGADSRSVQPSGGFCSNQQCWVARATAAGGARLYWLQRAPVRCTPHATGRCSSRVHPHPQAPQSRCGGAQSLGLSARNHKMSVTMRSPCEKSGENEEEEKEAVAAAGHLAGVPETQEDSDSDLETEGASRAEQRGTGLSLHLGDFFGRSGRGRLERRGQGIPVQQRKFRAAGRQLQPCALPEMLLAT